jgi:hypothetical protein
MLSRKYYSGGIVFLLFSIFTVICFISWIPRIPFSVVMLQTRYAYCGNLLKTALSADDLLVSTFPRSSDMSTSSRLLVALLRLRLVLGSRSLSLPCMSSTNQAPIRPVLLVLVAVQAPKSLVCSSLSRSRCIGSPSSSRI